MKKKNTALIRVRPEDRELLKELSFELSLLQKKKVPSSEIIRRTLNIPSLKDVLKEDAKAKRRIKQ